MIHARVTNGELRFLRRGVTRTLAVEKRPGRRRPQIGAALLAYAPATYEPELGRDGARVVDLPREEVRCRVTAVENGRGEWTVSYTVGSVEPARFLRARPGMVKLTPNPDGGDPIPDGDADYTTSVASAAHGEPECVPESWEREVTKQARTVEQVRDDYERRKAIEKIEAAIDDLERVGLDSDRGRVQQMRAAVRRLRNAA